MKCESTNRLLNIIDEQGNIIGEETREKIHKQGLLHREIRIWFYTSKGEIIFQHRAEDKDTYPELLDATVGGHVEIGMNYEKAALQELKEETGVSATIDDLEFIQMMRSKSYDPATDNINNVLRAVYAYRYNGEVTDLKVELGKGLRFEVWSFEKIFNISDDDRKKFIPQMLGKETLEIFKKLKD